MTESSSVSRRNVLRIIGAAIAGFSASGVAEGKPPSSDRHIVGTTRAGERPARQAAARVDRVLDFDNIGKAVVGKFPEQAREKLSNNPAVRYVEEDGTHKAINQTLPWGVERVDADVVHGNGETGSGTDVAVLDTGIDSDHPDLQANLGEGKAYYESETGSESWDDDNGHGTHCAGIVGAIDNTEGVVGVAPDVTLHAVKVLASDGFGYWSDIAAGLEWAVNKGYPVASMSLGGDTGSYTIKDACQYAEENGTLVVAGAGNEGGSDSVLYPAKYSSVMAISATTQTDSLASYSSRGPEVELAAPGSNIYSTYYGGGYNYLSGTSMACPHVSGAAALLSDNGFSRSEIRSRLKNTAEDIGLSENESGAGLLDAEAAVSSASKERVGEVATTAFDQSSRDETTAVPFEGTYSNPVVFAGPLSWNGGQPAHPRIWDVREGGMDVKIEEWLYLDGAHVKEQLGYVVFEEGVHTLSNGLTVEVGTANVEGVDDVANVSFGNFDNPPVVLAEAQTSNGIQPIVTRVRDVTADGAALTIQEEEDPDTGGHLSETVGYIAVEQGTGSGVEARVPSQQVNHEWASYDYQQNFSQSPVHLAKDQTQNGWQPCNLRARNRTSDGFDVFLQEETSEDDEVRHLYESIGLLAIESEGALYAEP